MTEITFVLGLVSTVCVTYLFIKWILHNKGKRFAPGPVGFPILGHLPFLGKNPSTTYMRWWKTYGNVFSIKLGSWNAVVVNGYKAHKAATEHAGDAFSGRPNFISFQAVNERTNEETFAFGNFSPVYLKQRKLASKALRLFTSKRPEVIENLVTKEASAFADNLIKKYKKFSGSIELDVQILVVRIIYQRLYGHGKHVDVEKHVKVIMKVLKEVNDFSANGNVIDVLPFLRYLMPWKANTLKQMLRQADHITLEQVSEHYRSFSKEHIRDVADAILASEVDDEENKDKNVLTRARFNMTLADLQGPGSDTTHKTLAWLFLYMSAFPQVQDRVQAEIDDVVGKGRQVELKDKPNLVYTNAVILEVMRIVTPLPFAVPHSAVKQGEIEGFHVDKDTVVIFHLYSIHHERDFWGDPECFRPERLISTNNTLENEKCSHILPFSLGRRRCVGEFLADMNVFLSFATVMQKCKFVPPVGKNLDLTPVPGLVFSPKDYNVQVCARNY